MSAEMRDLHSNDDDLLGDGTELPEGSFDLPCLPQGLREAVFARTAREVRRRAGRRRLLAVACLAGLFIAGVATGLTVRGAAGGPEKAALPPLDVTEKRPRAGAERGDPGGLPAASDPRSILTAVPDAPAGERPRLLREAGDRWLALGEIEMALDCYRQVLEVDR